MSDKKEMTDGEKIAVDRDIAAALMAAAEYNKSGQRRINIRRKGELMFTFVIEAVSEEAWNRARRESTRNKGRRNEEMDSGRYLSYVIYEATIDEDKKKLWQNKSLWPKFNATSGVDLVQAILKPAEKMKIAEEIENMSGYSEDGLDGLIENL